MFCNQYDRDVITWSPQGRLLQVEYATKAVELGIVTVALKSKEYAVITAVNRKAEELAFQHNKILQIDDHIGMSFAGYAADARELGRFMRVECSNHRYWYDAPMAVSRLIAQVGKKLQICTQRHDRRPLGVGLLVVGYDDNGLHIFQTSPSANTIECRAMAIGCRSQYARDYLEKHQLNQFESCNLDTLVAHGLRAIRETLPDEMDLDINKTSIGVVGKDYPFKQLDEKEIISYLCLIKGEERESRGNGQSSSVNVHGNDEPEADPSESYSIKGAGFIKLQL